MVHLDPQGNLGNYWDNIIVIKISRYWKIFLENSSCPPKGTRENGEIVNNLVWLLMFDVGGKK